MGYVNKIQIDEDAAHLIEPTLYGICSTAAATAIKDITLDSFTLIPGVLIAVKFTVTNTAAVSGLKLRVNSTNADDAKPIKYRGADLPDKGTLANKRVYLFLYDGTNWEFIGDIDTNTNTNTLQRTFRSSSNVELPIAGINASNSATATYNTSSSISSGSYASMYAAIPNTVANLATINPSTGKITVPGGVVADVTGNASTATNVALSGVTDAENLQAIEALTGTSGFLKKTAENTWSLDTSSYVTSSGVTSLTIKTSSPLTGGSDTATTSTGTYTIGFSNQDANTILAGPSTGDAAAPTFRALVASDIPNLTKYKTRLVGSKSLNAVGWYRILNCTAYSMAFLITFYGGYNHSKPSPVTFLVSHAYNETKISQIGRNAYIGWITKIRAIHYDTSKFYIDLYFAGDKNNQANFEITPLDPNSRTSISLIDYTLITDTLTSNAECSTTVKSITDIATAANITSTLYGITYYSDTAGTFASTGAGISGLYLKSNGTSAPTWETFPSTWEPSSHTHGNITNDGKLTNVNRLVWTNSSGEIYAGYHYAATDKVAINSSTAPTENFYVSGTVQFNLGTTNTSSNYRKFIILGASSNKLSIAPSGILAYNSSNAVSVLYLQAYGGNLIIGSSDLASATRDMYGVFDFKSSNGFTYSGIGAASTNVARNIWFSYDTIRGRPVYDDDFKYNPSTNVLSISSGTFDGSILKLHQGTGADPSLTGNARIEFDYTNGLPVVISYTPNDSYRNPAGLKVIGGTSATPAWFEVEGSIFANGGYRVPHTGNTTGSIGGTTTPVYVDGGLIKAGTALGTASLKAESYFVKAVTSTDNAVVRYDGASGLVLDSGVKIDDGNNITGFNSFKYNTRYYPFIKEFHERTKWYKITFPYSTATTDSSNHKLFMNSFDIHIGGAYSANAAGVIHVTFYWQRMKDNGAWSAPLVSAKFDGILMNKVKLYYRIAEPGVLYVNNESNNYNGIWITDLYNDDTATTLDWTTTTITSCNAITSSTDPALSAYTLVPSVYTYTNDSTYCIDNLIQLTKNLILYNAASSGNSPSLIFKRASDSTLTDWRIYVADGKLSFCTALDGATWTERASFADNSGNFTVTGTMTATNFYGDGANITLGAASAAVVTDASKKLTTRGIKNITGSANNLEWTSSNTDNTLVTTNTLAYWNGRYNSTSSNLAYCKKGEFGTIITNNFPTSNTTTTYLRGDGSWVSLSDMGLSTAMHYKGTVEASPTTTAPTGTFSAGDVVVYDSSEYVYDGTGWRELGSESSFKTIQDAVSSPSVPSSGTTTATAFIDTISLDANGVITPTKKNLPVASTSIAGIIQIGTNATNAMAGNTVVTNVYQSASTTSSWRKILLSTNTYSAYNTAVGDGVSGLVYDAVGVSVLPSTGSIRIAGSLLASNLTIGGTSTASSKTIASSSTLYLNRATDCSIIFLLNGVTASRIDTTNAFRPETTNTLSIGTSDYKWNAMYATTLYAGNFTIGGTVDTDTGKRITSSSTFRFNRPANYSIAFEEDTTVKMSINTSNNFVPATDNTLQIGESNKKWNAMYATTFYGNLDGNANTASAVGITTHTNTTNGNKTYYLPFLTAKSGNLSPHAHSAVYLYETVSSGAISKYDFCFGASAIKGSITLWDGSNHWGNISTTNLSGNRTYTLPNASGTIALTSDLPTWSSLGGGASGTHADSYFVKAITSTDNAIVRFNSTAGLVLDSGLIINDNDMLTIPGGSKVYSVSSVNQSGYVKWATLTISGAYQNEPIVFEISRRGDAMSTIVQVQFLNTSSSDPTLTSFTYYGSCANIYIKKSATSTWDLYASKTENYDLLCVLRYHNPYNSKINVEWKSEHITDAVEDWTLVSVAPIKVLGSNVSGTVSPSSHTHGNITNGGCITTAITKAKDDYLIIGDNSDSGKLGKGPVFCDTISSQSTSSKFLREDGTWSAPSYYSHPTGDGNLHVPATSTTNNGKVLLAGSTAGSLSWVNKGNARVFYGTCNTAAGTAAKVITCATYDALTAGDIIIVTFDNANSAASPTLNVNSKGAKNVKKLYNGAINNLTANAELTGTCIFVYDGTLWVLSNADYNNTYTVNLVKLNTNIEDKEFSILLKTTNNATAETGEVKFAATSNKLVTVNPSTGTITAPTFKGALHSFSVSGTEKAYITYNSTDNSLDFVFV